MLAHFKADGWHDKSLKSDTMVITVSHDIQNVLYTLYATSRAIV